ncbi:MAG: hypothetical protein V3V25_03965 [Paracoccaceae bacterium]
MTAYDQNPFDQTDPERAAIWDMLVYRDIQAFSTNNWPAHAECFLSEQFFGIDAQGTMDSDKWRLGFATLAEYKPNWVGSAQQAAAKTNPENLRRAHFDATDMTQIDVNGDQAICHKNFDGSVTYDDGSLERLLWKTIYQCRKVDGQWRVGSFIGFLPNKSA